MTSSRFGKPAWTEDELRDAIREKGGSWDVYCEKLEELELQKENV